MALGWFLEKGYLSAPEAPAPAANSGAVLDVRETVRPPKYSLPISFSDPYHKPHLENFFNSIKGEDTLNCPVEIGYETAVSVLRVNEAVATGRKVVFDPKEFHV